MAKYRCKIKGGRGRIWKKIEAKNKKSAISKFRYIGTIPSRIKPRDVICRRVVRGGRLKRKR